MTEATYPANEAYLHKPYRWMILILIGLIQVSINFASVQMGALALTLITALGLTSAQFGAINVASFLVGVIFGIPSGAWADRFGIKPVISIAMIISTIGGVMRIFCNSFGTVFIAMALAGFSMAVLSANSAKIIAFWFPKSQMSIAMSVYVATAACGGILALLTTPRILAAGGSITTVYIYGAAAIIVVTVLWLIFGKSKPEGAPAPEPQHVMKYIGEVIGNKHLWISSAIVFLMMGSVMTLSSFIVTGLTALKGVSEVTACTISTMTAVMSGLGALILPSIVSKFGRFKVGYIIIAVCCAAGVMIGWSMPFGVGSMIVLMFGIFFINAGIPILKQYAALLPGIKPEAIGSAGGLQCTFQNLGAFLIPSYILGTIAGTNYNIIFIGVGVSFLLSAVLMLFLPEVGSKAKKEVVGQNGGSIIVNNSEI